MFNTKSEVDKHVENCLKKITNEKERNNRGYTFAKLYYNVGDYEQTRRYITSYLSVKPKSPEGHYLLGLTFEKLGKKDSAVDAYKTSLQLDPKQNNLVLKVCELLARDDLDLDMSEAKYFCQLAENVDPNNPSIYNLKEKLIMTEQKDPESVTKLLLKELENRPTDVNLRIRLIRNFMQNNRINEAYKHVYDVEEKNLTVFSCNLKWYETIADVLIRYKRQAPPGNLSWGFWCLYISVMDKVVGLRLDEKSDNIKESIEYISQLFFLDQSLYEASQNNMNCPDRQLSTEFFNHYRGQLYLHFATTIFKQAKKDLIQFKEASAITLPLLFASYHLKPVDLQASWINHLQEPQKRFVKRWHQEGAFRCSQSGHTLLAAAKDRKSVIMSKATQYSSGMWQEQLFKKVFVVRDQQLKIGTSFFVNNQVEVNLTLPTKEELLNFDEESLYIFSDSLQHYIWVSLNNDLADLKYLPFQGLQYSIKNLSNCGAETLNLLDVQAFIYCASLCAESNLKQLRKMLYYNSDKPEVLPEAITGQLGSIDQTKFLIAAHKMYKNETNTDSGELRLILIRGIEAVRCIGRHGLDVNLLIKLAEIFEEKSKQTTKKSEIEFCDARAELYWNAVLPLLEKMKNNQAVTYASNRIFDYKCKELPLSEICDKIDKGKLFLGVIAMKRNEHEKALNKLEELKDPYASFYQAQIYKKMADHQMTQNKESVTSEMRSQNVILLSKARDCFYLTLDRLREPAVDKNHPLNTKLGTEIEKIERLLSRIDPDCSNRNDCDGMSDENVSSADSTEHYTSANFTHHTSNIYSSPYINVTRNETRNNHSTPMRLNISRKEARPSPERLDAQLRQLVATKDSTVNQILEQNKIMLESHRCLVDELRSFKDAVYNLSGQVDNLKNMRSHLDELKEIKKSVDDLKISVDELQSFRNVSDMVYELKREIVEMKKDNVKHQQVSDDIYAIDDDYPEYNIGANVNFNPNLYQNYPNRLPAAVPPAAALYPHGLYPSLYGSIPPYGYPNLGLSQPGLPYGADQQLPPDLRALANPMSQTNPLYPPPALGQTAAVQPPPINLASSNINTSLLTGQGLSQVNPQLNMQKTTSSTGSTFMSSTSASSVNTTKSAPVNVVITSSDPLPALQTSVSQPVLSVTIPPQHIKGAQKSQPHNYQIPLPTTSGNSPPSVLSKPAPAIATEGMLSNVAPPVYSAVTDRKSFSKNLGLQIEKSLDETFSPSPPADLGKDAADPPTEALPMEKTLFECPAKLYSFINDSKEFKERGNGMFKLLHNKDRNTVRILMKQDLGKTIANHYITKDLKLASTKENAYYWSAIDYSDGKQSIEKFCLKFKNADDAKKFFEAFESAKQKLSGLAPKSDDGATKKPDGDNKSPKTLGGFMFTSSPIFKPTEAENITPVKPPVEQDKNNQSPFANFSFGLGNKSTTSILAEANKTIPSLLSSITSTPPKNEPKSPDVSKNADSSLTEEFVPTAVFQPVIPLPDIVEIKTGEEDAEVLFNGRAKLLRFDSEKKEWKERGLGNMKILKEKSLIRLLMRREHIHKVCCNHQLIKSMNFQYMPNNFKALTWCAQDFADEVLKSETLAIKFKTEEQTSDFLKCILAAQASLNDDNLLMEKNTPKKETKKEESSQGFGNKFKPAEGSWECSSCYITNQSKADKCVACAGVKPGIIVEQPSALDLAKKNDTPKTAAPKTVSGWGDAFKPKAGTWECQSCMVRNESNVQYCVSCESPKDDTVPKKESSSTLKGVNLDTPFKFNFGIPAATTAPVPTTEKQTTPSAFKFGTTTPNSSAGFSFGSTSFSFQPPSVTPVETPTDPKAATDSFVFGSPVSHSFDFKPRSPRKSTGPGDEESDCSYVEEEADNIYFKPVIPLPNKVEVKTGEEDEEVLYCHRAKLFRFSDGEWKERGVGDLKILKNKSTNKLRVLMRRDQVHKICLNHALTSNIEYLPKDEQTWLFVAADFSEGEVSHDKFCIRFKTPEIAKEFKEAVSKALDGSSIPVADQQHESDDASEVEFVSESSVTAEELKEAQHLGLPPKFFAYKQLPLCSCGQCSKDDSYFEGTILEENADNKKSFFTPKGKVSESSASSGSPIFHTPGSFGVGNTPKQETLKDILSKPSLLSQSTTPSGNVFTTPTSNVFSTPVSCSTTTAGNLFGSKLGANTNIFAAKTAQSAAADSTSALNSFSFTARISEAATEPKTSGGLFSSSSSIFCTGSENKSNIFGGGSLTPAAANENVQNKSIFSNQMDPTKLFSDSSSTTSSIFGTGSTKATSGIFGQPNPPTNLFGTNTSLITSSSIFGSNTSTTPSNESKQGNLFGTPKTETSESPFGFSNANNSLNTSTTPGTESKQSSLFGTETSKSPFGSINSSSLFGSSNTSLFGSGAKFEFGKGNMFGQPKGTEGMAKPLFGSSSTNEIKTADLKENDEVVLKTKSEISFSSLAHQNKDVALELNSPTKDGNDNKPFAFLGAGAPVFGSAKKPVSNTKLEDSQQGEDENEEAGADEEYDPHYEPIIPMPEAIVVSTGEEDETAVFNERAKLYRYDADTKEWKERGVGQMKILHHPNNGTYRFLLRREQVHKVVLNQLITPNLELQPMKTSDSAWVWAGHNYVEDQTNLEKLAIKFKYPETAKKFEESVQNCMAALEEAQSRNNSLPATIQNYGLENVSSDDDNYQYNENDYDEDDDPYDDDYQGDRILLFSKTCTLQELSPSEDWVDISPGNLQVYDDGYGPKIAFVDEDGAVMSNSVIGINTVMNVEDNQCTWRTVELANEEIKWRRDLRASFDSEEDAQEFFKVYLEGLTYAQEWEITDDIPDAEVEEID